MLKYALRRILFLVPTLLLVSFFVYGILNAAPGDPAQLALGEGATETAIEAKRIELGLDKPFIYQYFAWLKNVVFHFDFGKSYRSDIGVAYQIKSYFPNTLKLAGLSVFFGALIGIPVGILASVKQSSWFDNFVMSFAMIGMSVPAFVLALIMILIFSVKLRWLPPSGFSTVSEKLLPILALGMQPMAICARMTRSSMLEVIRQDYIRTIRAKGQSEFKVVVFHAFKNALMPILTTIGLQFGALIGGAFVTETIFLIPGLGRLLVTAVTNRDYPLVLGGVVCVATVVAITNLLIDMAYSLVDPRVQAQFKSTGGGGFSWLKILKRQMTHPKEN
ncbi:ABC transporter permease [Lacrimispora sp.]|uniref:ABC transporter permease n=1 Tax=Lacrimispora sp. TaxID=2719234 RepID=UPI0028B256BE|nr:ABC transporter permease [Lacrimispora sp.]